MRRAMERRGHEILHVDPYEVNRGNKLIANWSWRTGALFTDAWALAHIQKAVGDCAFDVAFVDNGEMVSAATVSWLKTCAKRVLLFNRDNPFSRRDGYRWRALWQALPHYDLYVTTRQSTADRARASGIRNVLRVNFFADEILHHPFTPSPEQMARFGASVSFVGTWFPERGPFMQRLLERGVPLKIIGQRWERARNYAALKDAVVPGYLSSEEYAAALRCSRIAIAMLSKGNEDLQTSRSSEIPALGVLLCAERTSEHEQMYEEGSEAVFWSTVDECADLCLSLLADPDRLTAIAAAGRQRVLRNDNWCEPIMERILETALAVDVR